MSCANDTAADDDVLTRIRGGLTRADCGAFGRIHESFSGSLLQRLDIFYTHPDPLYVSSASVVVLKSTSPVSGDESASL